MPDADDISGELGILAEKTRGQGQPGAPFLQRQESVALTAQVHQIALPIWLRTWVWVGRCWIGVRFGIDGSGRPLRRCRTWRICRP